MPELFDPARHEPLIDTPWDAGEARRAIERIVAEVRAEAGADGTWPVHPNDGAPGDPLLGIYMGGAGVALGLDHLVRIGAAPPGPTFAEHLPDYLEASRGAVSRFGGSTRSYLMADAGIRLAQWRAAPSEDIAGELAKVVAANAGDPALELMWGAPGTMLAALAMHRWTGEPRWAELYRQGAEALDRAQAPDPPEGGVLWVQDLYGARRTFLGAVHGFASIARALIVGRDLIEPSTWASWSARLARTLEATAVRGDAGVNWAARGAKDGPALMLVQHCHGAPGMIFCFAELDAPIDVLLLAAGELTWAAGPLTKGANFCHGTDGNGYAFLKLFQRTGDALWLERARAFAMHAIAQSDAAAKRFGRRRATLWTGDVGLAAYLADCLEAQTRFPSLEFNA